MKESIIQTEIFFMALADRTRLRLLNLMREGEVCVCYFTAALRIPQPRVSRHLAYLRQAQLVETTRVGKWIYYQIAAPNNESAKLVLQKTLDWLADDPQMQRDHAQLTQIICNESVKMPVVKRTPGNNISDDPNMFSGGFTKGQNISTELADYLL